MIQDLLPQRPSGSRHPSSISKRVTRVFKFFSAIGMFSHDDLKRTKGGSWQRVDDFCHD